MERRDACLGLALLVLALLPWPIRAEESRPTGTWSGLDGAPVGHDAGSTGHPGTIATLSPGSVLIAQAGGSPAGPSGSGWQFTLAPYLWTPRTEIDLAVGTLTRSTTIDFSDIVDDLNFAFTGHFEASWREWTALLDLMYLKLGKDETTPAGVQTELDYQQLFFEFGGTYRLATLPVGRTGHISFEALAGGRVMYVDTELTTGGQSRSRDATLVDPMFGGRLAYHITDSVALWLRGDVAGFGLSDSQSQITYNVIAGLSWRFTRVASLFAGWRYMHVEIEKGSGARTLDADLSLNGPFLGFNFYF